MTTTGGRRSFTPIGMPAGATQHDTADQRLALHLLETLDALTLVYESAAHFASTIGDGSVYEYTLTRCLQSASSECGAIYHDDGHRLELQAECKGAHAMLDPGALAAVQDLSRVAFYNGHDAAKYLRAAATRQNVLVAPIATGQRRIGIVAILRDPATMFHTVEAKLVAGVTSQAAIAISSALHYRDVEIERSKLRAIIEKHPLGIVVLHADGETKICNSFARQLCGLPEHSAEGIDVAAELARLGGISPQDFLGRGVIGEIEVGTAAARRIVGFQSHPILDSAGKLVNAIVMLQDLTEQRREERLKRDFLSLISHKFRTPITAILAALELLELADTNERTEFVGEARRHTDELAALVDRLLCFSEIMEGSWSTRGRSDLRQLRAEIDAQLQKRPDAVAIEWGIADDACLVAMPPARLRVVLDNLIDNAIRFAQPGQPWVKVSSHSSGAGWLTVDVEDHGPGIPANERSMIFRSFHQREEEFTGRLRGAGIGLAMAAGIVRRVGGSIDVRDASPRGSVFSLTLPSDSPESGPTA